MAYVGGALCLVGVALARRKPRAPRCPREVAGVSTPAARRRRRGCLLGDESRAAMCLAMLDGGAWTVSELADAASVGRAGRQRARRAAGGRAGSSPPRRQGRHKFVRLAGPAGRRAGRAAEPASATRSAAALAGRRAGASPAGGRPHLLRPPGRPARGRRARRAAGPARLLHRRGRARADARGAGRGSRTSASTSRSWRTQRRVLRARLRRPDRADAAPGGQPRGGAVRHVRRPRTGCGARTGRRALVVTPLGERAVADLLGLAPADLAVGQAQPVARRGRARASRGTPRGCGSTRRGCVRHSHSLRIEVAKPSSRIVLKDSSA